MDAVSLEMHLLQVSHNRKCSTSIRRFAVVLAILNYVTKAYVAYCHTLWRRAQRCCLCDAGCQISLQTLSLIQSSAVV